MIFKHFSRHIVIDASPAKFIFTRPDKQLSFSISTFIYLDNSEPKSALLSVGEELPKEHHAVPGIRKIDLFEMNTQLPPDTTFSRSELIQLFFEFGIGRCFEATIVPALRPVVTILGVSKFNNLLANPKDEFEKAAKRSGAGIVLFEKTDT